MVVFIWGPHFPCCCFCCSAAPSCPPLCDPMDGSAPGFPVLHYLPEFAPTHVHWVNDAIQPSHPLSSAFLLPSVFPSIRVFSKELALQIRWPKYRSFSFTISPSSEYSGLISLHQPNWTRKRELQLLLRPTVNCPPGKNTCFELSHCCCP